MRSIKSGKAGLFTGLLLLAAVALVASCQAGAPPGGGKPGAGTGAVSGDVAKGKTLYQSKGCEGCHSIGGGRRVGPDLKNVTTREDREFLMRMIVEPDKLIAEGNERAKQLVQEYGTQKPNLGVSRQDAEDILAHINSQSQ